jgi:hypothetical protein
MIKVYLFYNIIFKKDVSIIICNVYLPRFIGSTYNIRTLSKKYIIYMHEF